MCNANASLFLGKSLPTELWLKIFEYAVYPDDLGTFKSIAATCPWMRDIVTLFMIKPEPRININLDVSTILNICSLAKHTAVSYRQVVAAAGPSSGLLLRINEVIGRFVKDNTVLVLSSDNFGHSGYHIIDILEHNAPTECECKYYLFMIAVRFIILVFGK